MKSTHFCWALLGLFGAVTAGCSVREGTLDEGCCGPVSCENYRGDGTNACQVCLAARCCAGLDKCVNDTDCVNFVTCVDDCATTDCTAECISANSAGYDVYTELGACSVTSCATDCSSTVPITCDSPTTACSGTCVNLKADNANCGACGNSCGTGESCFSGACCVAPAVGGTCSLNGCGCDSDQTCYPNDQDTGLSCVSAGNVPLGGDCRTAGVDCRPGLSCFGGICRNYCASDSDCPLVDGARSCLTTTWSADKTDIEGVKVCSRTCDPINPQSPRSPLLPCDKGFGCDSADSGASNCYLAGEGVGGDSCESGKDCAPGFYCSNANTCREYCSVSSDCSDGAACDLGFSPIQHAGQFEIGYCCDVPPAGGKCSLPACGCADGEVCYPTTPSAGMACLRTDNLGEGDDCSNNKVCAAGLGCFGMVCKPYCKTTTDCAAVDGVSACLPTYFSADQAEILGVSVCARVCDPVSPQSPRSPLLSCPAGFGCKGDVAGLSWCYKAGTAVAGGVCTATNPCAPGYGCSDAGLCEKLCASAADCATGNTCKAFTTPLLAGTQAVGRCVAGA